MSRYHPIEIGALREKLIDLFFCVQVSYVRGGGTISVVESNRTTAAADSYHMQKIDSRQNSLEEQEEEEEEEDEEKEEEAGPVFMARADSVYANSRAGSTIFSDKHHFQFLKIFFYLPRNSKEEGGGRG